MLYKSIALPIELRRRAICWQSAPLNDPFVKATYRFQASRFICSQKHGCKYTTCFFFVNTILLDFALKCTFWLVYVGIGES